MLEKEIETWEDTIKNDNDNLTNAILTAVLFVANSLLSQKAVLLPWVCQVFLEAYGVQQGEDVRSVYIEERERKIQFSSRWLLDHLIVHLHPYMMHKCVHMRFGTVLYRRGADLLIALSWALSSSQQVPSFEPSKQQHHTLQNNHPNTETILKEASIIINNFIHEEINKLSPSLFISINDSLNNVNPLLLQFLTSITDTIRERKTSNITSHAKKIRMFFILCQLMFCTNPKKPPPIYDIVADTVEVCGGSRKLMRILNRLGCSSSPDTHDRFVTDHAMARRQVATWDELSTTSFTIASVDNFDMLQSYSAVYCGDQQRSYHGTTLQLVQPGVSLTSAVSDDLQSDLETVTTAAGTDMEMTTPPPQSPPTGSDSLIQQMSAENSPQHHEKNGPKRQRTMTVNDLVPSLQNNSDTQPSLQLTPQSPQIVLTLENFLENNYQANERISLDSKLFSYIIQKYCFHHNKQTDSVPGNAVISDVRAFLDNKSHHNLQHTQHTSVVHYMELLDENPDCTETMSIVAEDLLAKFYQVQDRWVVLVGDGKTYRHLMNVKKQYSTMLRKLLIFPGDWHILKNYQPVLMKEYYSAGLREMAKNSGYHGTTLKSLEHCSNFKRTHYFLLQTWEALYREMWHAYVLNNESTITEDATCILLTGIQTKNTPKNMMERICELVKDSNSEEDFKRFVKRMSENDKTWKFWAQFVFTDCFCYFGLYLAIRSSNWELRIASLKLMAPMFAAFDREYYARILPHHLAEIQRYPPMILKCFERGAFTVKLTQQHWRAVALDEAHEMCINKDLKTAIARPTKPYLKKITLFLNDRTKIHNSFIQELFPERFEHHSESNNNILDDSPQAYKYEHNIKQLCSVASEYQLFCVQPKNRQLLNVFTGQVATNEQACDMLSFRNIGEQAYQDYVKYHMLQYSTITKTNLRQHKLLTMASKNTVKRKGTAKERDDKHLIMCLRRHLVWSNYHKLGSPSEVQYSEWPRALADEEGNPHKGNKSAWTTKLVSRYQSADAPILVSHLPFVPHTVIVDAMFLLNTRPLRQTNMQSSFLISLFYNTSRLVHQRFI